MAIHRFKFSPELNEQIQIFANLHMYDENFKESFDSWCETPNIAELITNEDEYLSRNSYTTDTKHKMYRSIKYYYVKKFTSHNEDTKKERKRVNKVSKQQIEDIKEHLVKEFEKNPAFKPSDTYEIFKNGNDDPLLKKCYKNQYYQIKNKMYNVNV